MKTIISASRRTDLPRWFIDETIESFKSGEIWLYNVFSKKEYKISLKKEDIHSIVWWSKDFSIWIDKMDFFKQYNNFFQFTINGYSDRRLQQLLESGMPLALEKRLEQVEILAKEFGKNKINWRFDPILFWKDELNLENVSKNKINNNTGDFKYISEYMGNIGIERCVISFCDWNYEKVINRAGKHDFKYYEPSIILNQKVARWISGINKINGIKTFSCANEMIVDDKNVFKSHCIDGDLLEKLFKEKCTKAKHGSQRETCGCVKSSDIGKYTQKCKTGCLYCYAR